MDIKYAYYNTSKGYRVMGGTAAQFLKADGSLDSKEYIDKYSEQNIEGAKWFRTAGGNQYLNHRLRIISDDGSNPGMVFYKSGVNVGTIQYDGPNYLFTSSDTSAFSNLVSAGYIKEGSNDGYALLGGGGHKAISDFVLSSQLVSYVTSNTTQTIDSTKTIGSQNTIYSGWERSSVANPQMGPFSLLNLALQGAYPLYGDEEFRNGTNGIGVYNNYGNGTVTMTREAVSNLPNRSGMQLRFNYNGNGATPGLGGFILGFNARSNAIFIQKFMAKLPVGYSFYNAENYMGDNASITWLTSIAGTGKWETYVRAVICGTGTGFGNGGHVYVGGPDTAMEFYLAFAEIYEVNSSVFSRIKEAFYAKNETIHFNGAISDLITVGDSYAQKRLLSTSWDGTNGDQIQLRVPGSQNNGVYLRYSQNGTLNGNIGLLGSDNLTGDQIFNPQGNTLYLGNPSLPNMVLQTTTNAYFNYAGVGSIYTFNVNGVYLDRNINFNLDNSGINFHEGGKIYKKTGGGVYINRGTNGLDPRIENADGSQSWKILHEGNHTPFKNLRSGVILEEVSESGIYRQEGPTSGFNYTTTLNLNSSDGRQQLTIERQGGGLKFRGSVYGSGDQGWSEWHKAWTDIDFSQESVNSWNTAYNHTISDVLNYNDINGDWTRYYRNDGSSFDKLRMGTGIIDSRVQGNGLGGNGSANLPNSGVSALNHKALPLFHSTSQLGWSSSLIFKGWTDSYKAWKIMGPADNNNTEQDFYLSQTRSDSGEWMAERKIWTSKDFSQSHINAWNNLTNGIILNQEFSYNTGYGLGIYDGYFGGESGIIDNQQKAIVAGKIDAYYKYGSSIYGLEGVNYHWDIKNVGIGGDADPENKVRVEGCVKATENFKSKDEEADTLFIPDGRLATLRDEIINDKDYAIRLDPHEYIIDPTGYLEIDDRNRLIHIIGEQINMAVNFREIYPKQQIVIYNFDLKSNAMEVRVYGKTIYKIEPGCLLRLYVTKSLRLIIERDHPAKIMW